MAHKHFNATCPAPISTQTANTLSIGLTLQHLLFFIALACTGVTVILIIFLIWKHLHRYTRPDEQRQIIRLVFTPIVFAVFSLLAILSYDASEYLLPLPDLYESYGLACLFVLFVHYVQVEHPEFREDLPTNLKNGSGSEEELMDNGRPRGGRIQVTEKRNTHWFDKSWVMVFQYPVVKTILTIAQLASTATGTYCAASKSPHFGHIWITIISNISIVLCFLTIVRFYRAYKHLMVAHKPFLKLLSFKLIVFIVFLQNLVFNFIHTPSDLLYNGTMSPRDLKYGIPAFIECVEMLFFAVFFHYSFRSKLYHPLGEREELGQGRLPVARAAFDAVNPMDIIRGVGYAFSVVFRGRSR